LLSTDIMANLVFCGNEQPMNTPSLIYLENRVNFYSTLLPRVASEKFAVALETAIAPLRESDELVHTIQLMHDLKDLPGYPDALPLDDLLKKPGFGQQLAKITISVHEVFRISERIELIGHAWFQALSKQDLTNIVSLEALATSRLNCLQRILKLRDEMDFHRLRLL
jgi:hypothetical protein